MPLRFPRLFIAAPPPCQPKSCKTYSFKQDPLLHLHHPTSNPIDQHPPPILPYPSSHLSARSQTLLTASFPPRIALKECYRIPNPIEPRGRSMASIGASHRKAWPKTLPRVNWVHGRDVGQWYREANAIGDRWEQGQRRREEELCLPPWPLPAFFASN